MTLADQAAMTGHDGQVTYGQPERPKRRTFTAAYKARILAEYDALPDGSPQRGELMRRERLYHSHLEHWRHQQEKGTLPATAGKPGKSAEAEELARLRAENKKLKAQEPQAGVRSGQDQDGAGHRGKSIRAAGEHLRQRGFRRELNQVIDAHFPADGGRRSVLRRLPGAREIPRHAAPAAQSRACRCRRRRGRNSVTRRNCRRKKSRPCWRCWTRPGSRTRPSRRPTRSCWTRAATCARRPRCTGCCASAAPPASAGPRPCTRRGRNPNCSPPHRTRCGAGTSRN